MVAMSQLKPATVRKTRLRGLAVMVILLTAVVISNTHTTVANSERAGRHLPMWEPAVWESSSAIMIAVLVPAVGWWLTQFPLIASNWKRNFPAQLLATLPFSLVQVAGMVTLRDLAYRVLGRHYEFGSWWPNWFYEYCNSSPGRAAAVPPLIPPQPWGTLRFSPRCLNKWRGECRSAITGPETGLH